MIVFLVSANVIDLLSCWINNTSIGQGVFSAFPMFSWKEAHYMVGGKGQAQITLFRLFFDVHRHHPRQLTTRDKRALWLLEIPAILLTTFWYPKASIPWPLHSATKILFEEWSAMSKILSKFSQETKDFFCFS